MKPSPWLVVVLVGAALGLVFAGVSTYDFVQHLDRQVHQLHCSFIPGVSHGAGESGCQVAMMSPYSSIFRSHVWGGIPISLGAMSVFAFIAFFTVDLLLTRRKSDRRATGFLVLAAALPTVTSIVMLTIALTKLGTTCKLCIGIYIASAMCIVGAIVQWRGASRGRAPLPRAQARDKRGTDPAFLGSAKQSSSSARLLEVSVDAPQASTAFLAGAFGIGVLFVVIPLGLYLAMAPDHTHFIGTCDGLTHPDDTSNIMVQVGMSTGGAPTIEILDPLCPSCKAFEERLGASGLEDRLDRKAVLFPLDKPCNWMITEATHPGACTVSKAVLCAGKRAPEVIAWAFAEQDNIKDQVAKNPTKVVEITTDLIKKRFPELAQCVVSPEAEQRLNKSLHWGVTNGIRVLTPQLYIDNVKLCDEDVDLGLEYTLSNMLDRHDRHMLVKQAAEKAP